MFVCLGMKISFFLFLFFFLNWLFCLPFLVVVCVFHLTLLLRQIISEGEGVVVAVGAAI